MEDSCDCREQMVKIITHVAKHIALLMSNWICSLAVAIPPPTPCSRTLLYLTLQGIMKAA